ncbi:aminopeptidase N-like [Leptopilina heterotoma]|uniref:aminopeptidase N-like n=1 Tax=Leptopilina heterotoma TaxID=63436 RepID=UPI001CA9A09A|nr:aminopeptidase N-like [Leptopilina heterotoma]
MKCIYLLITTLIFLRFTQQLENYKLPTVTKPLHYEIQLEPHLSPDNLRFDGEEEITIKILHKTNNLTLHSLNLFIFENKTLLSDEKYNFKPSKHIYETENEFLILKFINDLQPGIYKIKFKFSGKLKDEPEGFFWDSYVDDKNNTIYLAATEFEPSFARRTFPCWDEPALKATFDISIKHFSNYTALSNMPIKKTIFHLNNEKIWTIFQTTPLISTYLVCFTLSDFVNLTNTQSNITIWSQKNNYASMILGLDVTTRALNILETYTDVPYALPKLEIFTVPNALLGGMENWGLIILKEVHLVGNTGFSTVGKFDTNMLLFHEVAHQWFGNLVSPAWWNDLWIMEGLCSYLQYFLLNKVYNNSRIMDLFVIQMFQVYKDDEKFHLPLFPNITSSSESNRLLRSVHKKSAIMMYMLSNIISKEALQNGVKKVLEEYRYGTVTTNEFLEAMQESMHELNILHNNFEIKEVMMSYISQVGYPLINISRNYTTGSITLTQECPICSRNKPQSKFFIPINFVTSSSLNFSSTFATHWLRPKDKELVIEGIHPEDWVIFNIKNSAYYRVNYDETNWERIKNYLNSENFSQIHVLNRAQLLDNVFWLYQQKLIAKEFFLNFILYLTREVDYIPWENSANVLYYLFIQAVKPEFKECALKLVKALSNNFINSRNQNTDIFTAEKRSLSKFWNTMFKNLR